ncbi:MAG: hypothetical protein ACPHJV_04565, partial [Miltoncostaeaceae bacterium]
MIRPPTVLAVVAASLGVAAGTAAAAPISFSTCAGRAPVQCGTLEVPLDHAACPDPRLLAHAMRAWDQALELGRDYGYRNAQATVIA